MMSQSSGLLKLRLGLTGLLTAGGAVACAATLSGFLGRYHWFLDLFANFRVQYLIGLTLVALLQLFMRRRRTAIVFLGFAITNLLYVAPLYFGGSSAPPADTPVVRVMLINVSTGFGDVDRVRQVVTDADPAVLVLEEISPRWMADLTWLMDTHPYRIVQTRDDNFGIGLFSKFPLADGEMVYIGEAGVPSILATVNAEQMSLRVIATHPLPPKNRHYSALRNEQLQRLSEYTRSSLPLILIGDLNTTPWSYHFRQLLKQTELKDSARGFGVQPSWPANHPIFRIPLDHVLHSSDIAIVNRQIGEDVNSDHYPVIVDLAVVKR